MLINTQTMFGIRRPEIIGSHLGPIQARRASEKGRSAKLSRFIPVRESRALGCDNRQAAPPTCQQLSLMRSAFAQQSADGRACNRAGNRARTDDLLITNQLLYQLSY